MAGIPPEDLALMIPIIAVSIPVVAIWTSHARKMAELRLQSGLNAARGESNTEVAQAIQALRQEMAALRDTTTRFDMSFDAALSRLEQRVDSIEGSAVTANPLASAAAPPPITPTTPAYAPTVPVPEEKVVVLGQSTAER